jgi:hypothetical protein
MQYVQALAAWLKTTRVSWAVAGGIPWLWPLGEILHFIGLSMLVGIAGVLDLRMLGVAKGLPLAPLQRLIPFAVAGFLINMITGFLFFTGDPFQYIHNYAFWLKMLFIALAGVNVLVFYALGLSRRIEVVGPGQDVPLGAKITAAVSLFLWVGVMFWGRMLPFLGTAF